MMPKQPRKRDDGGKPQNGDRRRKEEETVVTTDVKSKPTANNEPVIIHVEGLRMDDDGPTYIAKVAMGNQHSDQDLEQHDPLTPAKHAGTKPEAIEIGSEDENENKAKGDSGKGKSRTDGAKVTISVIGENGAEEGKTSKGASAEAGDANKDDPDIMVMVAGKDDVDAASQYSLFMGNKDFRYYFQHPYVRIFTAYFVVFCNFLIYAEDPVAHSRKECLIPMIGNAIAFVATRYPPNAWTLLKVVFWITGLIIGMVVGKLLIHKLLFNRLFRLKMFSDDQGSWMVMFLCCLIAVFIMSLFYNLFLMIGGDATDPYRISDLMGVSNDIFMKVAACGTWCGDFFTAWMVTDIMLQEKLYPQWAKPVRKWWRRGYNRIILFWIIVVVTSFVVIFVIATDYIQWDKLNRDFMPTNEVSRAFLASFILVMDLLIVMQDWDFPHFVSCIDIKLPGLDTSRISFQIPKCLRKDHWNVHITGIREKLGARKALGMSANKPVCCPWKSLRKYSREAGSKSSGYECKQAGMLSMEIAQKVEFVMGRWFNYGILFIVMLLDMNMWKNQIFFVPYDYGQYTSPEHKLYTVQDDFSLENHNETQMTYAYRSETINPDTNQTYIMGDTHMNTRYLGAPLSVKGLAFIPSLAAFITFGLLIWIFGRFKPTDTDPYAGRLFKRMKNKDGKRRFSFRLPWQRKEDTNKKIRAVPKLLYFKKKSERQKTPVRSDSPTDQFSSDKDSEVRIETITNQNETIRNRNESGKGHKDASNNFDEVDSSQPDTNGTQNEAIKTVKEAVKPEIEAVKTQNEAVKTQNEAVKTQNEAVKTQNETDSIQNEANTLPVKT